MSEKEGNNKEEEQKTIVVKDNRSRNLLIFLLILLVLSNGYFIWKYVDHSDKIAAIQGDNKELSEEKRKLQGELKEMIAQYEEMEANNEELSDELKAEKKRVEELLEKSKNQGWEIYKLKKETKTLRKIMKGYVVTIDSLNTANQNLIKEKQNVETELSGQKDKNKELQEKNKGLSSKVSVAAQLKLVDTKAYGVKIRSWTNTSKEVDRAGRTDELKVCFTILDNRITEAGKKWIYVRILAPDGEVLAENRDEEHMFEFNGVKGVYSMKKLIDYQNKTMDLCIDWEPQKEDYDFPSGQYNVTIYADAVDIGRTQFELK